MAGVIYSVPYQLFIGAYMILTLLEWSDRKRGVVSNPRIQWGCISLYLFFIGLRGYIGTDWYTYHTIFEAVPTLFTGDLHNYNASTLLDSGFIFFVSVVKTIWNDYHFLVFVSACLDVWMLHIFLKRYTDRYALAFLVFLIMGGLTLCDLLRNVRGIFLFLLSLRYLNERRPVPFFALNLLGFLFHWTSVFYLPGYWLLHRRWKTGIFVAIFLVGNIVFLFQLEFLRPLLERAGSSGGGRISYLYVNYLLNDWFAERSPLSIGYLERIVSALLIFGFRRKLVAQRATNNLFLNAYALYFFAWFALSEFRELSARASLLFIFSYWILFPALCDVIRVRFNRRVFLLFLVVYSWVKVIGMTSNVLYRYDNVLWGVESYQRRAEVFDRYYLNR